MAKVPLEMMDYTKFVRKGEEFFYGSNHMAIVREMGWTGTRMDMLEKLRQEGGVDLDMGLIQRWTSFVAVGQKSETFNYPGPMIYEMVRVRTMEVLTEVYDEDSFRKL